jgi:HD superfamily phosphohydrolase
VLADIIQAVNARFYQYNSVYYHKTVMASSLMVEDIIRRSVEALNLIERTNDLSKFVDLTDDELLAEIKFSPNIDAETKRMAEYIKKRNLPKIVFEVSNFDDPKDAEKDTNQWLESNFENANEAKENYYYVSPIPIHSYDPKLFDKENIYIFDKTSITFEKAMESQSQLRGLYNDKRKQSYHPARIYKKPKTN